MTTPYLTRFRNGEYLQYMKDVLKLVNKQDVALLELTEPRDALSSLTTRIDDAFQHSLGSALTQEIIALDERRDKAFIGFKSVLNGFTYHIDTTKQAHAKNAMNNIENYGKDITRKSYQEETAIISSLINDLETKPELIAAVDGLNVTDWLTELKSSNEAFAAKYIERVGETAANPLTSIQGLRANATVAYKTLVYHIQAHKVLSSSVAYISLLEELEVLTKQYNAVVDNRTTTTETNTSNTEENT